MSTSFILQKKLDFPAYGITFQSENVLFLSGGSGTNRSGVKSMLTTFKLEKKSLIHLDSLNLSEKENYAMSIDCHPHLPLLAVGINDSKENVEQGKNLSCKIYDIEKSITLKEELLVSKSKNVTEHQKVTKYSKSGDYLAAIFSDGRLCVWSTTSVKNLHLSHQFKDLQDVDFDSRGEHIAVATSSKMFIISLKKNCPIIQTIDSPKLNKKNICGIRFARYAVFNGQETLYAIVNTASNDRSFICAWPLLPQQEYPVKNPRTTGVSRKNISCFSISPKGDLLAFASNDFSLTLMSAGTFEPLLKIPKIHSSSIADIAFNRSGIYLATVGVDNMCNVIGLELNKSLGGCEVLYWFLYCILNIMLLILLSHITLQIADHGKRQ